MKFYALLNKQRDQLEQLLCGINPFNAKNRAAEIGKLLDSYIPSVEKMQTQLKKYSGPFTETITENKKLKKKNEQLSKSLEVAEKGSVLKKMQDFQLRRDYEEAVSTLERIPQEVLDIYTKLPKKEKENAYGR